MENLRLRVIKEIVPSFSVLEDEREKRTYAQLVRRLWGTNTQTAETFYPCCNPIGMSRAALAHLTASSDYVVGLKADGVRYCLLLTCRPSRSPPSAVALLVDRAWNMYEVDVTARSEHFTRGTLFEGEVVWKQPDEEEMVFLVFDALHVKGEALARRTYEERFARVQEHFQHSESIVTSCAETDMTEMQERVREVDAIVLTNFRPRMTARPKSFVHRRHVVKLWGDRGEVDYRVDGIVLQRRDASYSHGAANDCSALKWKQFSTVDLSPRDVSSFSRSFEGNDVRFLESKVVADGASTVLEYVVFFDEEKGFTLVPIRKRNDKTNPNSSHVVRKTLLEVMSRVDVTELAAAS